MHAWTTRCAGRVTGQEGGGSNTDCSLDATKTHNASRPADLLLPCPAATSDNDRQHYNKSVNIMAEDTLVIGRAYA